MTKKYVNWGSAKVKLTWNPVPQLPPRELITSVHAFCFKDGKLLLVKLQDRGWDFPGGHIELNESPEECIKREAYEEGYVTGRCYQLGYIVVDHSENLNWNESSPYPKVGYQVFYRMDIDALHEFLEMYESKERLLIDPNDVKKYYVHWNELYQEILDLALSQL
ncbi:NUDIX domain-containing protein [Bacillus timonensis]|uniref:NUDIX domain-containing protein n=1 Tax=Bacillus timonensis TaxID=1033734 RepID=A0A4S3PTT6_9BACI|nr:NUDIX domain-containing protein [Bacillus timonensis]THE13038.1 NUDIX domain-containing protein [Bacillus timonensis]